MLSLKSLCQAVVELGKKNRECALTHSLRSLRIKLTLKKFYYGNFYDLYFFVRNVFG